MPGAEGRLNFVFSTERLMENDTVAVKVEGMTCNNCALNISRYLEKEGMEDVMVSFATGDVRFRHQGTKPVGAVVAGINRLGYRVQDASAAGRKAPGRVTLLLLFSAPFTLLLLLHMVLPWHWLHLPYVQLALALPVFAAGMWHFGGSALRSLKGGMPNMDVLVTMGALAAFVYSLLGTLLGLGSHYLFYETAASIITLVLLGNYLEEKSVHETTSAIGSLAAMQAKTARILLPATGETREIPAARLLAGDQVLVNTGDQIPADGTVAWGEGYVNESMITGESRPVFRLPGDPVVGGTILEQGSLKVKVTATGERTVLAGIIELVRRAQGAKSAMQRLADRISAVFVPAVILIALATFLATLFVFALPFQDAMMRAIAVMVIACPCAMGLATPAAVMVGLGRAARQGILIKGGQALERFGGIRQVVFDKTGTLTTGKPAIVGARVFGGGEADFRRMVAAIEAHSTHPVAAALQAAWHTADAPVLKEVREVRGLGMEAQDGEGHVYRVGAYRIARELTGEDQHQVYVTKDGALWGWVDLDDTLRPEAAATIARLRAAGIRTILLSGDSQARSEAVAGSLGLDEIYGAQLPEDKMRRMEALVKTAPTAMVGDGINDAPALALADIGVSFSDASHIAVQSSDVVLLGNRLDRLPMALGLGAATYRTIKQNLFWAFFYNVIAIPLAAAGLLSPIVGAAVMGLSDVVLVLNSLRLRYRKL